MDLLLRHSSSHDKQYFNILQSTGQAIHIFDFTGLISYWNTAAEKLYGYSASEVLGQNGLDLVVDGAVDEGIDILQKIAAGEKWTGKFPVKNKQGKLFEVLSTNTPLFLLSEADPSFSQPTSGLPSKPDHDSQQPQQVGSFTLRLDVPQPRYGVFYEIVHPAGNVYRDYGGGGKVGIHKIVTSRGESWISKKQMSRPWKGSEHDELVGRNTHDIFGWMTNEQDDNSCQPKSLFGSNLFGNKAIGFWSSSEATSKRCVSRSIITGSSLLCMFDREKDYSHYDILWEELTICEQIGRGRCSEVFSKFEYSDDLLHSFRQEVLFMKRL
ncbi:hypothetical protein MKX01_024454 [Papaver californicum]|nr:hypothetical protein MKX01_024454 [Papaver californicum]